MTDKPHQIAVTGPGIPVDALRGRGFEPVALTPAASASRPLTAGVCAVARGWCEAVAAAEPRLAAAVLSTRCDQLRRAAEALREQVRLPVFVLNVPATHGTAAARRLLEDEARRLDGFLGRLPGAAGAPLPSHCEAAAREAPAGEPAKFRVGLLGCCLTEADEAALALARAAGLGVAADATERPGDARPTIAQRPNAPFFSWLRGLGRERRLDGWLLLRQPWCDLYYAELPRLKSETGLPWLDLETGAQPAHEALRTRVEAFAERLAAEPGGRA